MKSLTIARVAVDEILWKGFETVSGSLSFEWAMTLPLTWNVMLIFFFNSTGKSKACDEKFDHREKVKSLWWSKICARRRHQCRLKMKEKFDNLIFFAIFTSLFFTEISEPGIFGIRILKHRGEISYYSLCLLYKWYTVE